MKKTRDTYKKEINELDLSDLKNSIKVLKKALNAFPDLFDYCVERGLKTNKRTIKQLVAKCYLICEYLPDKYKNDIDYCSYIVKDNPRILKYCNPDFLEKDEIIRTVLLNGRYTNTRNPEYNFKFCDIFSNLKLETYESTEYKEKVMNIFFDEIDKKNIDYYSIPAEYYFDKKWLVNITVFNVIIKRCSTIETYDLRYEYFLKDYLKENCNEIASDNLIISRINELLSDKDPRLNTLLKIRTFPEVVDLIFSILIDKNSVEDMNSVVVLREIDKDLALKYEKKFHLNSNLDYQLLVGDDEKILDNLSGSFLDTNEIYYILKNYQCYFINFEQYFSDYPNSEISYEFHPYSIIEHKDFLELVLSMPVDSLIHFINAVHEDITWFTSLKTKNFISKLFSIDSILSLYDSSIRTKKTTVLKFINGINNKKFLYYYYWFISENLKLDEEIAIEALKRNPDIFNLLRKKIQVLDVVNNEIKNIENSNKDKELNKIKQFKDQLNKSYINFIKDKELPVYYCVDLFDLDGVDNINIIITILEFLVVNDESFNTVDINKDLFQTKEFFEGLSKNDYASSIFEEIKYDVNLNDLNIDPKKDIELIDDLLNKDILLPQCPSILIDTPEKAIHLINALDIQIYVDTDWISDDVIIRIICQNPDNEKLLSKYCESGNKVLLIEDVKANKNKDLMKKVLFNEEAQSSLFKLLDDLNHSIFENEDFLAFYCEKFKNVTKKVTYLPDIKNEKLLRKYYYPLISDMKDKLLLGATLTKKYQKLLNDNPIKMKVKKEDTQEIKNKKDDKPIYEIVLDRGDIVEPERSWRFYSNYTSSEDVKFLEGKILVIQYEEDKIYVGKSIQVNVIKNKYYTNSKILKVVDLFPEFENNINALRPNKKELIESKNSLVKERELLAFTKEEIDSLEKRLKFYRFAFFGIKAEEKKSMISTQDYLKKNVEIYTKNIEKLEQKVEKLEKDIHNAEEWLQTFIENNCK